MGYQSVKIAFEVGLFLVRNITFSKLMDCLIMLKGISIVTLLFIALLYVPPTLFTQTGDTYYISTKTATVRESAKVTGSKVTTLKKNDYVVVLEVVTGDKVFGNEIWYWVSTGKYEGYIHSSVVTSTPPSTIVATSAPSPTRPPARSNTRRPENCTQAKAWGLSETEAGRWSHLDRDNDGKACYGD